MGLLLSTLLTLAPPMELTASVERLDVQRTGGDASVEVEPFARRITLRGLTLAGRAPQLCPKLERKGEVTTLTCRTRRLWAALEKDARGPYLSLRLLRGTSWIDPLVMPAPHAWSARTMGIPDGCPGRTAAVIAECALENGDAQTAQAQWKEALLGPDSAVGNLRLGALALREGDAEAALKHFKRVSFVGPLGRLAEMSACELEGTCAEPGTAAHVENLEGLPSELRRDALALRVRRLLTEDRDVEAMHALEGALTAERGFCEGNVAFCQKLIEGGLTSTDQEARIAALSVYLTDVARQGPIGTPLAFEAAAVATEVGAPGFAASILAAITPSVERGALSSHLLEVIRLYLAAGDRVRAAAVLEYADGKLGRPHTRDWNLTRRRLGTRHANVDPVPVVDDAALQALTADVTLSTDLARAAAARSRAVENEP